MSEPRATRKDRRLSSECCDAYVVVPVDVTAHLIVCKGGFISNSLADSLSDIRRQAANSGGYDANEAYCAACGASVAVRTIEASP